MKKTILLIALVFTLSCSIATESSQPDHPATILFPTGIPVTVYNPIQLNIPGKVVTQVARDTENGGFVIPAGTKIVFYYKAEMKDLALPTVNVDYVPSRLPDGHPLDIYGHNSVEVSLVFTGTDYFIPERKEIKAASRAIVVFSEGGGLKPKTIPTPGE